MLVMGQKVSKSFNIKTQVIETILLTGFETSFHDRWGWFQYI